MARLNIELSSEDLYSLKKGGRIEIEMIGDAPKIIISAEPEFDFKEKYIDTPKPFSEGVWFRRCRIDPVIPEKELERLHELLEKAEPCISDERLKEFKEKHVTKKEEDEKFLFSENHFDHLRQIPREIAQQMKEISVDDYKARYRKR